MLPSPEEELLLHRRLLDGDPTATADLAKQYLAVLIRWLAKRNDKSIFPQLIEEAAEDSLLSLMKNPKSFVPARSRARQPLFAYLCWSAQGDLQNILQREGRQTEGQRSLDSVEQSPEAWKYLGSREDPSLVLQIREELERGQQTILAPARDGLSKEEQQAMDLMLRGERKTAVFARVLNIEHLSKPEQRDEVNRVKDKLKHRIKRNRADHA
jgi:hypothetical protein